MKVTTTPAVSRAHAACFERELQTAGSEEAMQKAAKRHAHFLLKDDNARLQQIYIERRSVLRGMK